ncbi:hypothetical protein FACS1894186_1650 [Alphaproteobacteria bacterium]|nr:hypothetical protein FACS1894186_1650 [Alphaproteobacteria bacterium]
MPGHFNFKKPPAVKTADLLAAAVHPAPESLPPQVEDPLPEPEAAPVPEAPETAAARAHDYVNKYAPDPLPVSAVPPSFAAAEISDLEDEADQPFVSASPRCPAPDLAESAATAAGLEDVAPRMPPRPPEVVSSPYPADDLSYQTAAALAEAEALPPEPFAFAAPAESPESEPELEPARAAPLYREPARAERPAPSRPASPLPETGRLGIATAESHGVVHVSYTKNG